ncbi:MAG: MqnA/MqnD/SBP family protein, partial [Planctomycetota bacterium]
MAHRIASVGYVNARPLIEGLGEQPDLALHLAVPSALSAQLQSKAADVALLPVIELQRVEGLSILPVGGIGCDGHTLTVRIFSQTPLHEVKSLACDPDSRTSVALARIVFAERFGLRPDFVPLRSASGAPGEARLLIGDKVVCEEPVGFEHQLDLGHAWKELTGLPFV